MHRFLRNTSGQFAIDPYGVSPSVPNWQGWGQYMGRKGGCCEVYDHSQPGMRAAWQEMALAPFHRVIDPPPQRETQRSPPVFLVDGIFADDGRRDASFAESEWNVTASAAQRWALGQATLLRETTEALSGAGGILIQNGGEPGTGGNAYMFESFNAQNATVAELLRLGESGVTVQA